MSGNAYELLRAAGPAWDLHLEPAPGWRLLGPLPMWVRDDGLALADVRIEGRYTWALHVGADAGWVLLFRHPRAGQMEPFDAPFRALDRVRAL